MWFRFNIKRRFNTFFISDNFLIFPYFVISVFMPLKIYLFVTYKYFNSQFLRECTKPKSIVTCPEFRD
jgi:hypothetical protein